MPIESVNPATGAVIGRYPEMEAPAVAGILATAARAYNDWRRLGFAERSEVLRRAASLGM